MDDPAQAKAAIQQTNRQLAPHQQIRNYTIWPEDDFPRTYTLKVKRPEMLEKLPSIRQQAQGQGNASEGGSSRLVRTRGAAQDVPVTSSTTPQEKR